MSRIDNSRIIKAATGTEPSARSWLTEAPLRMLMNNLHPDVAERPEELVVYGGIGKAPLRVDQVVHRAVLLVDEQGSEAAAATAIAARARDGGESRCGGGRRGRARHARL